jgi:hypothetical protein
VWNEDYQCSTRYREEVEGCYTFLHNNSLLTISTGQWEYDYQYPTGGGQQAYSLPVETEHQYTEQYRTEDELPADPSKNYQHDNGLSDITQGLEGATIGSAYGECQQYTEGGQYQQSEYNITDFGKSKGAEFVCQKCSKRFSRSADLDRHHKTEHLNDGVRPYECLVPGCPGNVKSWINIRGYRQHEKHWHGPWSCSAPGCSRGHGFGFSSEADLEIHQVEHSGDSRPDKSRDERYRRKGKGSAYKGADSSYGTQKFSLAFSIYNLIDLLTLVGRQAKLCFGGIFRSRGQTTTGRQCPSWALLWAWLLLQH